MNLYHNTFKDQLSWGALENVWGDADVIALNEYNSGVLGYTINWGGGMFQNINKEFSVYGTEVVTRYQFTDTTKLNASYGYAKIDDVDVIRRYPKHQVKLNLTTHLIKNKCLVNLSYLYNSSYDETSGGNVSDIYKDSRQVIDLGLKYVVNDKASIKLVIKNLYSNDTPPTTYNMNQPYQGNIGSTDRRIYLSMKLKF